VATAITGNKRDDPVYELSVAASRLTEQTKITQGSQSLALGLTLAAATQLNSAV
jgi:hypothetical protein